MKIKKILLPFFVILLSALLMTGCSKSDSGKEENSKKTEEKEKKKRKPKKKEAKDEDKPSKEEEPEAKEEETSDNDSSGTASDMNGQVLFDNDKLRLEIKDVNFNDILGPSIHILIENKTDDAQTYVLNYASVNDYMMSGIMYEEVQAKSSKDGNISFSSHQFEAPGITSMDKVTLSIRGNITGNYNEDGTLVDQEFTFYPTGKSPDSLTFPGRELQSTDEVLYDEKDLKVVVIGVNPDHFMGQEIKFYMENNTDRALNFTRSNFVINGKSIDTIGVDIVAAGKKSYGSVYLFSETLETSGIKEIKDARFKLRISDALDWFSEPIVEKDYEYKVK